jgi:hypothetical protein
VGSRYERNFSKNSVFIIENHNVYDDFDRTERNYPCISSTVLATSHNFDVFLLVAIKIFFTKTQFGESVRTAKYTLSILPVVRELDIEDGGRKQVLES